MEDPEKKAYIPVPSAHYTREYFEGYTEGCEIFREHKGRILPLRLQIPLELADIKPGMRVVDIGCGRGELVLHCAEKGASVIGIDYAYDAIEIAKQVTTESAPDTFAPQISILQSEADRLPFQTSSIDVIFMVDVVEHLYPPQLEIAVEESRRILKTGGRLIVHTMPNLWYYKYGYPLFRVLETIRGKAIPEDPRERCAFSFLHVNEQDPNMLKRTLLKKNFRTKVWLKSTQKYEYETSRVVRQGMRFLTSIYPFNQVFCNDIFAVGIKIK